MIMTNKDFWQSILNIIHQGFNQHGLSKLEEYAENFISQRLVYKRFSIFVGWKAVSKESSNAERRKLNA